MQTAMKLNKCFLAVSGSLVMLACGQGKGSAGKTELDDSLKNGFTNKAQAGNQFKNGLKEGKWAEYKNITGKPMADSNGASWTYLIVYKGGKKEGIVREYNWSGILITETPYVDGKRNGIKKEYYSSGKLYSLTSYEGGKKKWRL